MGKFKGIFSSWIFLSSLFSVIALGVTFYLVVGQKIEATIAQQLLNRKRIIARAEVSNITTFFEKFGNSVTVLARLSSIEASDADAVSDLDTFIEQRRDAGIIGGVVLTDKNGVVKFNSNVLGSNDVGESLADREFFIFAKDKGTKGKYIISEPVVSKLGASKGENIVVVASPVYKNNVFAGVVASSIKLEPLTERFLGLMKISSLTEVYLVDGSGNLLYSNIASDVAGSNISTLFSNDSVVRDKIKNALGATVGDQFRTEKYLIAYSPIILGTNSWLFIISSPTLQVTNLTNPIYFRQAGLFIIVATIILVFGVIAARKNQA